MRRRSRVAYLRSVLPYVKMGGSELTESFTLRVDFPIPGRTYLEVGDDCVLGGTFVFESGEGLITIGEGTYIGASTFISRSAITIGRNVTVAWGAWFYDHDSHSLSAVDRRADQKLQLANLRAGELMTQHKDWEKVSSKPIVVDDDAWIGMNAIILKGVTIGRGAVVGAGSVVTKDVEPWTVVAGNPARIVKRLEKE